MLLLFLFIEVLGYGFDIKKMKDLLNKNVYSFYNKQIAESKLNLVTFKKYGVCFSSEFEKKMAEHPEELFDPNKTSSRKAFLEEIKKYPQNARFFNSQEQMEEITIRDFTRNIVYNPKSSLYVDQSPLYPSLNKTIEMIVIIPHLQKNNRDFWKNIAKNIIYINLMVVIFMDMK